MLKKENRLRKKSDFDAIFKEQNFLKSSFLLLGFKKNNLNQSRFGIIVGKKISKKAVIRNKIKRTIREIIRSKIDEIYIGYDVVIIPYKEIEKKSFQEVKNNINKELEKAKLI